MMKPKLKWKLKMEDRAMNERQIEREREGWDRRREKRGEGDGKERGGERKKPKVRVRKKINFIYNGTCFAALNHNSVYIPVTANGPNSLDSCVCVCVCISLRMKMARAHKTSRKKRIQCNSIAINKTFFLSNKSEIMITVCVKITSLRL